MSKYFDEYENQNRRYSVMDSIYEKSGGKVKPAPPSMSTSYRLSSGDSDWSYTESHIPTSALKEIVSSRVPEATHGTSTSVNAANLYRSPAQYTEGVLKHLRDRNSAVIFSMDTEWLGGGAEKLPGFMQAAPVELGITAIQMKGKIIQDPTQRIGLAVQLDNRSVQGLRELIAKLESGKISATQLTDDQYRTLKDLMNYAGDSIQDGGRLNRSAAKAMTTKATITSESTLNLIKSGLDSLDPSNKHSRAIKRSELGAVVNRIMMDQAGFKNMKQMEQLNPILAFHNGMNADVPVWEKAFGQSVGQIFGFKKPAQVLDTYSWMKSTFPSLLGLYYGTDGAVKSPGSLEQIATVLGQTYSAHQASEDAFVGAKLVQWLWNDGHKGVGMNQKTYSKGSKLFSMSGMTRGDDNPLDYIFQFDAAAGEIGEIRHYQRSSAYRNRIFEINKEFEYEFQGKKYFGVLLHNTDDDLYSVVSRDSKEMLQSAIQSNFLSMDEVTRAHGNLKGFKSEILDYVNKSRSRSEYSNMFRGSDAYKNFSKYMTAYDYIVSKNLYSATGNSAQLNKGAINALIESNTLKTGQAEKFQFMFERMHSEIGALKEIKKYVDTTKNKSQQAVMLQLFKENLDNSFGKFTENVALPRVAYNQGRIFDPTLGEFITVDMRDKSRLANNLRQIAVDARGNGRHGFLEAKERLRDIVTYMGHGGMYGDPILMKSEVGRLSSLIDRVKPTDGFRNISDVAAEISDVTLNRLRFSQYVPEIENQEALGWRAAMATGVPDQINQMARDAFEKGNRYFNRTAGVFSVYNDSVPVFLDRIDEALKARTSAASSVVAGNLDKYGPEKIMDVLNRVGKKYAALGVSMNANVVIDTKKGPGLQLVLFAQEAANDIMNKGASVWVPLIDRDSGMIQLNGVKSINRLRPTIKNGGVRLETYQNKLIESIGYNAEEVAEMLVRRKPNTIDAAHSISRMIAWATQGSPSAGMYGFDELMKDTVGSTPTSNIGKNMQIDMKDLIYHLNGRKAWDGIDMKTKDVIKRGILYNEDAASMLGVNNNKLVRELTKHIGELGLSITATGVKPEAPEEAIFNLASGDYRKYGFLGLWNDPGTENLKQVQRYRKIATNTSNNTRRYNPLLMTQSYYDDTLDMYKNGFATHLNVSTAFLSDDDILSLAKANAKAQGIDSKTFMNRLHQVEMPTTHDDMMTMKANIASLYRSVEEKKITLDPGDMPLEHLAAGSKLSSKSQTLLSKGNKRYDEYYDGIVRGVRLNEEKGAYEIVVDQQIVGEYGSKFAAIHGGNKFTSNLVENFNILGLDNSIEAIALPQVGKRPGDFVASQINFMVDQMTIGKVAREEIETSVQDVIRTMLTPAEGATAAQIRKASDVANSVKVVGSTASGYSVIAPDGITGALRPIAAAEKVFQILNGKKLKSNKISWTDVDTGNTMTRYTGLMALANINVTETPAMYGAHIPGQEMGGVKMGFRELGSLRERARYPLIRTEMDDLIGLMENKIYSNMNKYKLESTQLRSALEIYGKGLTNDEEFGIIRTRTNPIGIANEKQLEDIIPIINNTNGKYKARHLAGTIADPSLFGGNAYYLELPETFQITRELSNGKTLTRDIDRILIPALRNQQVGDDIYLNDVHKKAASVFGAVKDIMNNYTSGGDPERIATYEAARGRMPKLLDEYLKVVGNAVNDSHGYLAENVFSTRMEHSARLRFRGFNSKDFSKEAVDFMGGRLGEGQVLVSRSNLESMLGGAGDTTKKYVMDKAQDGGFAGLALRSPSKDAFTSLPVMVKVLSEADEGKLAEKGINFSGGAFVTVGTQAVIKADFDGDMLSLILPTIGGRKAGELNHRAHNQLENWYRKESNLLEMVAEEKRANVDYMKELFGGGADNLSDVTLMSREGTNLIDAFSANESKILKSNVGRFSNLSVKMRRVAETVGKLATDEIRASADDAYNIIAMVASTAEQAPISAKKYGEIAQKELGRGLTASEIFERYTNVNDALYEAMSSWNGKDIVKQMKVAGFIKPEEMDGKLTGRDVFVGATKGEDILSRMAIGRTLYAEDIEGAFDFTGSRFANPTTWDPMLNVGIHKFDSGVEAIEFMERIGSGDSQYLFDFQNDYLKGLGKENLMDKLYTTAGEHYKAKASHFEALGGARQATYGGHSDYNTMGDGISAATRTMSDFIFGGPGIKTLGVAAGAVGGLWLLGSVSGTPKVREQKHGQSDQAPSADGQYVDPNIYAGAPPGAGPSARLLAEPPGGHSRTNVNISARSMSGMTNDELAALVSQEVQRQSGMNLNINVTSQDDRTSIDRDWLQQQFGLALKDGVAY